MGLLRPLAHAIVAGPVRIHIRDGVGRTGGRALGITAAEIAFDHFACALVVVDRAEGTSDGAHLATDTDVVGDFLGAGERIERDRLHRARVQAPRERQRARLADSDRLACTGDLGPAEIREHCVLDDAGKGLVRAGRRRLQLNTRGDTAQDLV